MHPPMAQLYRYRRWRPRHHRDLDAVPGIGAQGIAGTEYGVNASIGRPEVDIQAMPIGIVVYLPDVAPVTVARNRELDTAGHITTETEVEAGEGLGFRTRG